MELIKKDKFDLPTMEEMVQDAVKELQLGKSKPVKKIFK